MLKAAAPHKVCGAAELVTHPCTVNALAVIQPVNDALVIAFVEIVEFNAKLIGGQNSVYGRHPGAILSRDGILSPVFPGLAEPVIRYGNGSALRLSSYAD